MRSCYWLTVALKWSRFGAMATNWGGIPQYFGPDYSFCHPLKLKFILHASERELSKVFRTGFGFSLWWSKLKLLTWKVELVGKIVSITGHDILLIFLRFQICCLNIKVEMSPNRSFLHSPYQSFWHFWKKMCSLAWFLLLLSRDGQSNIQTFYYLLYAQTYNAAFTYSPPTS